MKFEWLAIPELLLLSPARHSDDRGLFSETPTARAMQDAGIDRPFVQDKHSMSQVRGVLRGLYCQLAPHAQGKLVRVVKGAIWGHGGGRPPWLAHVRPACGGGAECR